MSKRRQIYDRCALSGGLADESVRRG